MTPARRPLSRPSPNFDADPIGVELLVLHYTAGGLAHTLEIFADPARKVSSHLVLDTDGTAYELVRCWDGVAHRAWHAGRSRWSHGDKTWEGLNAHAIGIEIVNVNGNVVPFTDAQYAALGDVTRHLADKYPALRDPDRVVGHEDIAGWRGKADPGALFDWPRFFADAYPGKPAPRRTSVCPPDLRDALAAMSAAAPRTPAEAGPFWNALSLLTETSVRLIAEARAGRTPAT